MKKIIILIMVILKIGVFSSNLQNKSVYTSTKSKDCKIPTGIYKELYSIGNEKDKYDFDPDPEECPGYQNIKIFKVYGDERVWYDISDGNNIWRTYTLIHDTGIGYMPKVRDGVIEWRLNKFGEVIALIFRVDVITDIERPTKKASRLAIISFNNRNFKFCGYVKTNEEAIDVADRGNCKIKLDII